MNSPTPTLNPNIPFAIKLLTDFAVGAAIRAGTSGDVTKEAAHAQVAIDVAQGFLTANSGDVTDGLAEIDAALVTSSTDPATAAGIQTAIMWVASKAQAAQSFFAGSVPGVLVSAIISQVANEVIAVAKKYIPAPAPAANVKTAAPSAVVEASA